MRPSYADRDVRFFIEDGCLVRKIQGANGRGYTQRCTRPAYERIAHAIDAISLEGTGTSGPELVANEGLPFTQVAVALDYLRERGVVVVRSRRNHPASSVVYENAMVEWFALAESDAEG